MNLGKIALNPNGRMFSILSKIFDLFLLSALWMLCCAPVVTIGASTAALYYSVAKVVRKDRGKLLESFFRSFRLNFKQGALLTLIYLAFAAWTWLLYRLASGVAADSWFGAVYPFVIAAFLLPAACMAVYQFPVLSRFDFPLGRQIGMAFCLAVRHFPTTLLILGIITAAAYLGWVCPLLLGFLPGVACLLCAWPIERVFKKYMVRPEDAGDNETGWCWE